MGRNMFHYIKLLGTSFNWALSTARNGVSTISLGNPFQCLTNLPSVSLKPLSLEQWPTLLAHCHSRDSPALWLSSWSLSGHNRSTNVLCLGLQNWTQYFRWDFIRAEERDRITSLIPLTTLVLMQPRIKLDFCTASAYCWFLYIFF